MVSCSELGDDNRPLLYYSVQGGRVVLLLVLDYLIYT
jgi:hypothetical protein